jgi:hypothetical protein
VLKTTLNCVMKLPNKEFLLGLVLEQRKDRFNWQESSGNSRKMLKLAV